VQKSITYHFDVEVEGHSHEIQHAEPRNAPYTDERMGIIDIAGCFMFIWLSKKSLLKRYIFTEITNANGTDDTDKHRLSPIVQN